MFGISGFDLLIVAVAGLILLGPEKLPEMGKTIGKAVAMFKRAQEDMQSVITAEMFTVDDADRVAAPAKDTTVASELYAVTDEDEEEEDEE